MLTKEERKRFDGFWFRGKKRMKVRSKLVNGSQVGQVGPIDSCGQVGDLDPFLSKIMQPLTVGQVGPVDSCGQVRNTDPSGSK